MSLNDLGNDANPLQYGSVPLELTTSDGTTYTISNPTGGSASTKLNVILKNDGQFTASATGDTFAISGKVTVNNTTFDGKLLNGRVLNFGFSNPTFSDTEFDVLLVVTGGLLTQQQQPAGIYQVGDELGMLIHQSGLTISGFPQTFSLTSFSGSSDTKTIQTTISGSKFDDLNHDGIRESGEPGLANWVIALYTETNGVISPSPLATTTTNSQGVYTFTKLGPLPANTEYVVSEVQQTGFTQTAPGLSSNTILLPNGLIGYLDPAIVGAIYTAQDFGDVQSVTITGSKFDDLNADGTQETGEPGLANWTIRLYISNGTLPGTLYQTTSTDQSGNYSFTVPFLPAGENYVVTEVQQNGWVQTAPALGTSGTAQLPDGLIAYVDQGIGGSVYSNQTFGDYAAIAPQGVVFVILEEQTYNGVVATFTDPNLLDAAGDFNATIDWGDDSAPRRASSPAATAPSRSRAVTAISTRIPTPWRCKSSAPHRRSTRRFRRSSRRTWALS